MYKLLEEEKKFYNYYNWCMDPMPKWADLKDRFITEISRWQKCQEGWIERELALNCWLMACSLWQSLSDYLIRGNFNFRNFAKYAGPLKNIFYFSQEINEKMICYRNRFFEQNLLSHERDLKILLNKLSKSIIQEYTSDRIEMQVISELADKIKSWRIPEKLMHSRIKIPSAFRSQDLTHYDILKLIDNYINNIEDYSKPVVIIGLRTTGAYIAPLAQAYLQNKGFHSVEMTTIRPKDCIMTSEKNTIKRGLLDNANYMIIDEPASTGSTIRYTLELLNRYGISTKKISIAFPTYPAHNKWKREIWSKNIKIYTIAWKNWYLVNKLRLEAIKNILNIYYLNQQLCLVNIEISQKGKNTDYRFGEIERIGWRLKQVYSIKIRDKNGTISEQNILVKSVGWGWYGYHAFLQGEKLHDFVPPILGLRTGFIFMRWIDGRKYTKNEIYQFIPTFINYICKRIEEFPLKEDMTFKEYSKKYYGGEFLCSILSWVYGKKIGHLIKPFFRSLLMHYRTKYATVIDGMMSPRDWIVENNRLWKIDYEHHGFGKTQLNIADPIYDIASLIFNFRLNEEQREIVAKEYINHIHDFKVKEKIMLYLWLIAHHSIYNATDYLAEPYDHNKAIIENSNYINDREYLNLVSAEYFNTLIKVSPKRNKHNICFIMDIDGVLDRDIWDFPTTTLAGIKAITLLRTHGFSIFINTARSLEEVKSYCKNFSFDGGIGEYGTVLWDENKKNQTILIDEDTKTQLLKINESIAKISNIYINPHYQCILKAFSYRNKTTKPLNKEIITEILIHAHTDKLKVFNSGSDTVIMPSNFDKGTGIESLFKESSITPELIISIGDSNNDIPMFYKSDYSFAPASLFANNKELKKIKNIKVIAQNQSGLYTAAKSVVRNYASNNKFRENKVDDDALLVKLIEIADWPIWFRLSSIIGSKFIFAKYEK